MSGPQLEEALAHGPATLRLAEVFGVDEKSAMRYTDSTDERLHREHDVYVEEGLTQWGKALHNATDRPIWHR